MAKASKKTQAAWDAETEARLQRLEALQEIFMGKTLSGTLRWFDASSGEGMAEVAGQPVHVHFSAIQGVDKNNYAWPTEADKKRLEALDYNVPGTFRVYVAGSGSLMAESVVLQTAGA